jgi:hypothetical protein
MSRALVANAELSFEMTPTISLDAETNAILEDTEQLLEIRRGHIIQETKPPSKSRSSPRIARKFRFQQDVPVEENMDTN